MGWTFPTRQSNITNAPKQGFALTRGVGVGVDKPGSRLGRSSKIKALTCPSGHFLPYREKKGSAGHSLPGLL